VTAVCGCEFTADLRGGIYWAVDMPVSARALADHQLAVSPWGPRAHVSPPEVCFSTVDRSIRPKRRYSVQNEPYIHSGFGWKKRAKLPCYVWGRRLLPR